MSHVFQMLVRFPQASQRFMWTSELVINLWIFVPFVLLSLFELCPSLHDINICPVAHRNTQEALPLSLSFLLQVWLILCLVYFMAPTLPTPIGYQAFSILSLNLSNTTLTLGTVDTDNRSAVLLLCTEGVSAKVRGTTGSELEQI